MIIANAYRFGKLVGLRLGPYLAVCVYDYDIAKEMLAKEEASGRPDIFWNNIRMLDKKLGKEIELRLVIDKTILLKLIINYATLFKA